jgi:hypothetical protein
LLSEKVEIADGVEIAPMIQSVLFHEIGAGVEPKYKDEKEIVQRHIDAKDIVTWAVDTVGFTGAGDLDTENVQLLEAVKAYKKARLAGI